MKRTVFFIKYAQYFHSLFEMYAFQHKKWETFFRQSFPLENTNKKCDPYHMILAEPLRRAASMTACATV